MAKELMIMAATEAKKDLKEAMDRIRRAEHFPGQASREAINKQLAEAMDHLNKVNNWLHAISNAR
jgi:hypothetical protein